MNTAKITEKQQEVCGIITEINQVVFFLLILIFFKYKTSITGSTYDGHDDADKIGKNETEIVVLLKHLSNFWRTWIGLKIVF